MYERSKGAEGMISANGNRGDGVPVEELSREEAQNLLDELARRYLNMSADEFIRRWDAGEFRDSDQPEVMGVAMLMPFAV